MSELKAGDRVRLTHYPELGAGTVADVSDTLGVKWDSGAQGYFLNENIDNELTRIEEPQPWQGECQMCATPITSLSACHYRLPIVGRPVYVCLHCWEEHTKGDGVLVAGQQEAAFATSRAWMHERHPDDPRWQEAE